LTKPGKHSSKQVSLFPW